MQLIDGKKVASEMNSEIAREVEALLAKGHKKPHLAAVLVGHDGASETYVAGKVRSCQEVGFNYSSSGLRTIYPKLHC
jgi:methylenetetrahydrofolate dehydrogenase (NADP+)/methenyltetrahydrofolate cyclohydrolase